MPISSCPLERDQLMLKIEVFWVLTPCTNRHETIFQQTWLVVSTPVAVSNLTTHDAVLQQNITIM
jgi:hypothetical protein